MRCVIQRVSEAYVTVDGQETGRIDKGLCALIGVEKGDTEKRCRLHGRQDCQTAHF